MTHLLEGLRPDPGQRIDVAFAVALSILGVVGFRTTFSGGEELVVGVPAVLVGTATGYVLTKRRVTLLPAVAVAVAVFFVLGGPLALRHRAIAGVLPGPDLVVGLSRGLVQGWKELLTTLPPAGEAGDLLTIPWVCGFAAAAVTVAIALRYPARNACVVPPMVLLAVSVLFGVRRPASLILQGAVFAGLTIAWVSLRHRHTRQMETVGAGSRQRLALAAGVLAVSCLGGLFVGPNLPGAGANDRYVLRDEVEPPFDPLTEPSALAGYRNFTDEDELLDEDVVTVRGLPEGARLRIAVMDDYDGVVWRSTGSGSVLAGEYLRVGARLPTDGFGEPVTVDVEVHHPHGVWVPLAGDVRSLDFTGPRGAHLDEDVRVSIDTDSAAVPGKLRAGDTYTFRTEIPPAASEAQLVEAALDSRFVATTTEALDPRLVALASDLVTRLSDTEPVPQTPYGQVEAFARYFRDEGGYTDGGPGATPSSPPGHNLRRILQFFANEQPFGNGEQFGAALGLLAQARGIPIRVAMGFVNGSGEQQVTFTGDDIDAWVEVPIDGAGWVAVSGSPDDEQSPDPITESRKTATTPEPQPPPATTIPPPTTLPDTLEGDRADEEQDDEEEATEAGFPVLAMLAAFGGVGSVLLGPVLLVVGLKARRRRRRRTRGAAWDQVAGSFAELVDLARDSGVPVPRSATRREQALHVATPVGVDLADRADAAVFGGGDPGDQAVDDAWATYMEARRTLFAELSRPARIRAALSVRSLRGMR